MKERENETEPTLAELIGEEIRRDYLGIRRTPAQFSIWITNCLKKASDIAPSDSYYNHRDLKKIREEAFPVLAFLKSGALPVVWIEPSAEGHSNFDFTVGLEDGSECVVRAGVTGIGREFKLVPPREWSAPDFSSDFFS